jgi:ABC-type multidrug transport system permease subunit
MIYSLPFLLIGSEAAFFVIFLTHFFIDRYPYNSVPWMSTWLLIVADNTLHLSINYLALRYL